MWFTEDTSQVCLALNRHQVMHACSFVCVHTFMLLASIHCPSSRPKRAVELNQSPVPLPPPITNTWRPAKPLCLSEDCTQKRCKWSSRRIGSTTCITYMKLSAFAIPTAYHTSTAQACMTLMPGTYVFCHLQQSSIKDTSGDQLNPTEATKCVLTCNKLRRLVWS